MRKFLFFLLVMASITASAQFKLTINGFVSEEDNSKDYLVYTFEGMSQEDLYVKVLSFVHKKYKNPDVVLNEIKNEMITISGAQESCISVDKPKKILGSKYSFSGGYDLEYTIPIQFKDGRIKVDAPNFECKGKSGGKNAYLVLSGSNGGFGAEVRTGLFKKNGEPSRENAIKMLEDYFNGFCEELVAFIKDSSTEEW